MVIKDNIMEEQQRIAIIKDTFNIVADSYDIPTLRFFSDSSRHLASLLALNGDEHVLDVATGTGHTALVIAGQLHSGRVTGVDFSKGMLEHARRKAISLDVRNADFIDGDMQVLDFPDNYFDAAVCSFGIFFVDDMTAQLSRIARTVKPGGKIAITCFKESYFSPQKEMLLERLVENGVQLPPQTWRAIASEDGCRNLFSSAGLNNIRVNERNMGYFLKNSSEWWDIVWNAGFRRMVNQIEPEKHESFKQQHLRAIEALSVPEGIWLDVGVLFTIGIK